MLSAGLPFLVFDCMKLVTFAFIWEHTGHSKWMSGRLHQTEVMKDYWLRFYKYLMLTLKTMAEDGH